MYLIIKENVSSCLARRSVTQKITLIGNGYQSLTLRFYRGVIYFANLQ